MQKNIFWIAIAVVLILLIPGLGNIFVEGWDWGFFDFVGAAILLFATGLLIDFSWRKISQPAYKIMAVVAIAGVLVLIWVQLAVQAVSRTLGF